MSFSEINWQKKIAIPSVLLNITRKFPPAANGNEYRDPQLDIRQSVRDFGTFCPKQKVYIKSPPSGFREQHGRGDGKNVTARGDGGLQENKAL